MTVGLYIPGTGPSGYAPLPPPMEEPVPEKIVFMSPRTLDRSTIVGKTEVLSLPVTNLQNQEPSKVYRTTAKIDQWVAITMPAVTVVNAVAMTWNQDTLSSSALWRVYVYETADDMTNDVSDVVDTGWQSVWPGTVPYKHTAPDWGPEVGLLLIDNVAAYRYVKVWITDPDAPNDYLDISRLAVGTKSQFRINPRIDGGIGFVPIDVQEPNGYGNVFTDPRPWQQRQIALVWSSLGQDDVQYDAMELGRLRGQAGDFFMFMDPASTEDFHLRSLQAVFEGAHKFQPAPVYIPNTSGRVALGWGFTFTCTQKL